jgi:hypothetical protein
VEHAADALCLLANGARKELGLVCNTRREKFNNLERVRMFKLSTHEVPVKCVNTTSRGSLVRDVSRQVRGLWIPPGFPKFNRAQSKDLQPYNGRVMHHETGRGVRTHRVLYTDKSVAWHALDQLKFLN